MLLVYARYTKGYKVLDLENGTIKISHSIALDKREASNIYEDDLVDSHPRTIMIRQEDDGEDQPSNLKQYGDDDVDMEEHDTDEDVDMEVRFLLLTSVTQLRERQAIMILLEA